MTSRRPRRPDRPPATPSNSNHRPEARLAVNLPRELHRQIKRHAAERGISIRELVLDLLGRGGFR